MNIYILIIALLLSMSGFSQADFINISGSNSWENSSSWTIISGSDIDGIPDADDNVTIKDGSTILIVNYTASCASMIISGNIDFTSTNSVVALSGTSTLTIYGDLTMEEDISVSGASTILNITGSGVVNIQGNINMDLYSGTGAKILMSANSGTLNFTGNFDFRFGQVGTFTGGSNGSTINFNGSNSQNLPVSSSLEYCNITSSNTSLNGLTLSNSITSTNVKGNLIVLSGATIDDGGYTFGVNGNLTNNGTYNASGGLDIEGDLINNGAFISAGCDVKLAGDFINNNYFKHDIADIFTFDGSAFSSIINGATNWSTLICNNPMGVTVSNGTQKIHTLLDIDQGTFSAGLDSVILISNQSGTAQLADIGTGNYSGNLTVQRYISKSSQSFTTIASPVSGTTLADWKNDGIIMSGFLGSNYPSFSWNSVWDYNETIHGADMINGWSYASNITNSTGISNSYKSHMVYFDAVSSTLSVTGAPNKGNISLPITFTSSGNMAEDGWNLIGNPYPSAIDWDVIFPNNSTGLMDGYFIYSGDNGNYAWYDGATTGTGIGILGATKNIPHSQGVWVKSKGRTSISITESDKDITDPTFIKAGTLSFMRINFSGNVNSYQDEALVFSSSNYSDQYDEYDVLKLMTLIPDHAPSLYTKSLDGMDLTFNKIGINNVSIPLAATAGITAQGTYTLDFDIPIYFMDGACIYLEDLHTGIITDLRIDILYSFTTNDTTTLPRFMIHIEKGYAMEATSLSCNGSNDGEIIFEGTVIPGTNFTLTNNTTSQTYTGSVINDIISFNNLSAGDYEVISNYSGECINASYSIALNEPSLVTSDFVFVSDTLYLNQGDQLQVQNSSSSISSFWDFGDGNTSIEFNPTHSYGSIGIYPVLLTSDNENQGTCSESSTKNIVVMDSPLQIINDEFLTEIKTYINNGVVYIEFSSDNPTELEINMLSIDGKRIIENKTLSEASGQLNLINTDQLSEGVYIINVRTPTRSYSKRIFIN